MAQTTAVGSDFAVNVGGMLATSDKNGQKLLSNIGSYLPSPQETVQLTDPFTGKPTTATVKAKNLAKGEAVYIIIETLTQ